MSVCVLVLPGAPASSATGIGETFALAADLARAGGADFERARYVGLEPGPVRMTNGLALEVPVGLRALARAELIVVPGLGTPRDRIPGARELAAALERAHARGATIASACTGAFLLAQAGLLDGRAATTHWRYAARLQRRHPKVQVRAERMIVEDRGVLTAGGGNASFDLALHLVARRAGPALAKACANHLVVDSRTDQRPYTMPRLAADLQDPALRRALAFLHAQYARRFTLEEVARAAGMSLRSFKRRFRATVGQTPLAYVQSLRIEDAKRLLSDPDRTVEEVAAAVGYADAAHFRQLFREHTGRTPRDFRRGDTAARQ